VVPDDLECTLGRKALQKGGSSIIHPANTRHWISVYKHIRSYPGLCGACLKESPWPEVSLKRPGAKKQGAIEILTPSEQTDNFLRHLKENVGY
jgi:hypothetical protein